MEFVVHLCFVEQGFLLESEQFNAFVLMSEVNIKLVLLHCSSYLSCSYSST